VTRTFGGAVAVVTGAAQGIGAGIATRLAADGARVVLADIDLAAAEKTAAGIRDGGGQAAAVRLDVADPDSVAGLEVRVRAAFDGPLRHLICNAGVQTFQRAADVTVEEWDRVLDVNARGVLLCMQAGARAMPDGGSVVAIASIQGRLGAPFYPHYAASKAGVISLVKSFALALAPRGIRVNAVAPGVVETPLWDVADEKLSRLRGQEPGVARAERIASVPLGRAGTPADVAAATSFLLSADASYITGETLHVCGGDVML
jgi:NAD(P)-dependent dehydrogenase (short-subunit alcohol dehydrogenase family)